MSNLVVSSRMRGAWARLGMRRGALAALMAAQVGLAGTAHAADLMYEVSLTNGTNGINATLDLTGVTQTPAAGRLYDVNQNWTIKINSATGAFASYAGTILTDVSYLTYLNFENSGTVSSHFFLGFGLPTGPVTYSMYGTTDTFYLNSPPFTTVSGTASLRAVTTTAAVPEPATWAMMIGGFGLVGASMRRRKSLPTALAHA